MPKPLGSKNFSYEEGERLAELAAQGLTKAEAAKALRRSYWVVMRHDKLLGIEFAPRVVKPRVSEQVRRDLARARAQRREVEDRLIREFARNGWTSGMTALELDLDHSTIWKHSKRPGAMA